MPIWKCSSGGYHSGNDCYEEYAKLLKHVTPKNDVRMVRVMDGSELATHLPDVDPETLDRVLAALVELTPDGKDTKAWDAIHRRSTP